MSQTKILLVDDHAIVIQGLSMILGADEGMMVVGTAKNGKESIGFVEANHVDLVIMDVSMPIMNGIEASRLIKKSRPDVKIIILTSFSQKGLINEMIDAQVDGCLLKMNTSESLRDAVARVMSGKNYFDHIAEFQVRSKEGVLSQREVVVLQEYCHGRSLHEMAETLKVSKHTVKAHLRNIRKKLNTNDREELMRYAMNEQII